MNKWYDSIQEPYRFMLFMALLAPMLALPVPWNLVGCGILMLLRFSKL